MSSAVATIPPAEVTIPDRSGKPTLARAVTLGPMSFRPGSIDFARDNRDGAAPELVVIFNGHREVFTGEDYLRMRAKLVEVGYLVETPATS